METAFAFGNHDIVDACFAPLHESACSKFPLFVTIGAPPLTLIVMLFVLKPHGDVMIVECPKFLNQSVFMFMLPLNC